MPIEINVTEIDDHRQPALTIEAGPGRKWVDEEEKAALGQRINALQRLAAQRHQQAACVGGTDALPDHLEGYSFRPANGTDVAEVAALVNAAYRHYVHQIGMLPGPMTLDYAEVISTHQVTVVEHDGSVVGVLVLSVGDEGFTIDNVAVDPAHRGIGLGRALLELAETEAKRAGFGSIALYTHEKMTENLALYSRMGYVEYDRRLQGDFTVVHMRKALG